MKIAPVAEVKARFSSYLKQCAENPVIVTKNGRPVAALIGLGEEDDLERLVLAHTPRFRELVDAAERRISSQSGLEHEDFWKSVESKGKKRRK